MRILLDECVPWPMHRFLEAYTSTTAQKRGWGGIKNGDLLRLAEVEFDLFITSDQNLRYQQNLQGRRMAIIELDTNDLRRIVAAGPAICAAVAVNQPGEYVHLDIP